MRGDREMTTQPAEIIRQARRKAEAALLQVCGPEIQRICDAFVHDTGLAIDEVRVSFIDLTTIGGPTESKLVAIDLSHEEA
jgi:hypothetical protein